MSKDSRKTIFKTSRMDHSQLFSNIVRKKSFLCVGLDTETGKLPGSLLRIENPVLEFNRRIIDATHEYAVAYKPNVAFYESAGAEGWLALQETVKYIRENYPDIFIIADAKRGDIGNTSKMYARAFFEHMDCDAVTVAPYMGEDSVTPFLSYSGKWIIVLALTSNRGADDFQYYNQDGTRLFEHVLDVSRKWGSIDNTMFVAGATRAEMLRDIRKIVPGHFLLVPGVGAQGGSLREVAEYGMNEKCGLLVNSSRGIIFADSSESFDITAAAKAREIQGEMAQYLSQRGIV
jgi:orotidine-5'-phosphate decarboxylase